MVVGVNGSGKTTTIGKLAAKQTRRGKRVLIAAGDTFRAAATEQLDVWAERAQAQLVKGADNADPSSIIFDAIKKARLENADLVIAATTGQNAIAQAKQFQEVVGVTNIALTKLDGTAKGGVIIGICDELKIPVTWVGVGEKIADLRPFDPREFVAALFDSETVN